ncbi:MAG: hypothetical protein RMJ54_16070 [Roseiflexaceae bacterium]|nr:hypothetical protein [Roseiflexus sp.]MDW8147690.1 hypothetical protein [Roseiflexaceae bacterium]MDW8234298.1 hypothetical protein [Roseiflexaceae bacterium]
MAIYWVNSDSDDALTLMAAVERALETGDVGTPPAPGASSPATPAGSTDTYLHDNLALARAIWSVDPHRIVQSNRPGLAAAINAFQRLVRRATWWYTLPQWLQISEFHGAVVRVLDALTEKERRLDMRIRDVEQMRLQAHLFALQQQIAVLRAECAELERRVASLEAQNVALRPAEADGE